MKKWISGLCLSLLFPLALMAAPTLTKAVPVDGSTIGITGSIVLMFNSNIQLGDQACTLNGETVTPTAVAKVLKIEYAGLSYSTEYTLEVPKGAVLDKSSGEAFAGITLKYTTQARPEVEPKLFDFVVDPNADKTSATLGKTIQSAFDAIPDKGSKRFYVFIKNGIYDERLTLSSNKQNVSFIGESRDGVVIQYFSNPAVEIYGKNIYFENLTFKATNNPDYTQYNIAIYAEGDQNIYKNVCFLGHQDTQRTGGDGARHYMKNCEIHGTIDFIYGCGDVFYDECYIYLEKRNKMMLESTTWDTACVIVAGSHYAEKWGHVFSHCTIDGDPSNDFRYSLGRPWYNDARAVYLNTVMKIRPFEFGWTSMGDPPGLYAEYGSVDAQGQPVDLSKRHNKYLYDGKEYTCDFNPVLTDEEAAKYTLRNVLAGSDAWHPDEICAAPAAPKVVLQGAELSWEKVPYTICYVIRRDGRFLEAVTATNYTLPAYGNYSVEAVGEYGFTSEATALRYADPTALARVTACPLRWHAQGASLLMESDEAVHVSIYDLSAVCVADLQVQGAASLVLPSRGLYLIKTESACASWVDKLRLQ